MSTPTPLVIWLLTGVGFVLVVAVDLVVIARRREPVTFRQATVWVCGYVGLAVLFGLALLRFGHPGQGQAFFAGYVAEYSLSVDNLFVFLLLLRRFAVPPLAIEKALLIGIVLSMGLRAVFLVAGAAIIHAASWSFYLLGAFLLYTALTLVTGGEQDEEPPEPRVVGLVRRALPLTPDYVGRRLAVRREGRRMFTPLSVVVAAIGVANVTFALDSMPAIFGLTTDTYVIITANAFALLGLRQLYFLLGGLFERMTYLNLGLAVILAFIGVKLVLEALDDSGVRHLGGMPVPHIGITASLLVILVVLVVTASASAVAWERARPRDGGPRT